MVVNIYWMLDIFRVFDLLVYLNFIKDWKKEIVVLFLF